jgi:hypothetical protein
MVDPHREQEKKKEKIEKQEENNQQISINKIILDVWLLLFRGSESV